MNPLVYPNSGALLLAGVVQTALATSEMHLYQVTDPPIQLTNTTTLADLTATGVEADYTGYAATTIAAWLDPILSAGGGAAIDSGLQSFLIASPYTVANTIQGWWVQDSTGKLVVAGDFPVAKTLAGAGDGIRFNVELIMFGT